ncbi:Dehydrogenase azaJ [Colletotrichum siamense]|uniref:Dehydrogenase azaJ n=1 Tax=Colletotrichum siamense TaxID=690259 RepID=UPI0018724A17|nr:Dehydrogenase azaJ [Colletotrichum siamense]KAF5511196.1 Dehydrogenase azaJ [Colletotrichum siamense]
MAVAINPVDGAIQKNALFPRTYPAILGMDLAGVVEEVGSNITHVKPGDRVLGLATSLRTDDNANSAFQAYALIPSDCVSSIPEELSFEQAAVLPLAIATAALGLFGKAELGLQLPSVEPHHMGQVVLVWGGATSVGGVAIQLAKMAGYEVFSTASPKNHENIKNLGATKVFDYKSSSTEEDIVVSLKGKTLAGVYEASGTEAAMCSCARIVLGASELVSICVACVRAPPSTAPHGVDMKPFLATDIVDSDLCKTIFVDFVPKALKGGRFKAVPQANVVDSGLEAIQSGIDLLEQGVSSQKIVVALGS